MRTSSGKVQAWQYAGIGVAMSQAVPTQCARRRVRRSGQLSKLGLPPQTPALREAISQANPAFAPRPPDGG